MAGKKVDAYGGMGVARKHATKYEKEQAKNKKKPAKKNAPAKKAKAPAHETKYQKEQRLKGPAKKNAPVKKKATAKRKPKAKPAPKAKPKAAPKPKTGAKKGATPNPKAAPKLTKPKGLGAKFRGPSGLGPVGLGAVAAAATPYAWHLGKKIGHKISPAIAKMIIERNKRKAAKATKPASKMTAGERKAARHGKKDVKVNKAAGAKKNDPRKVNPYKKTGLEKDQAKLAKISAAARKKARTPAKKAGKPRRLVTPKNEKVATPRPRHKMKPIARIQKTNKNTPSPRPKVTKKPLSAKAKGAAYAKYNREQSAKHRSGGR